MHTVFNEQESEALGKILRFDNASVAERTFFLDQVSPLQCRNWKWQWLLQKYCSKQATNQETEEFFSHIDCCFPCCNAFTTLLYYLALKES